MAQTFQTFLIRVKEAAVMLGEQETIDLITAVQQQSGTSRLRLLLVGAPGSGRFSATNALLQQPALLPASPIPRVPLPVTISYGESTAVEGISSDGITSIIAPDNLRRFLTSPDTDADSYMRLHISSSSDILKTSELQIDTIGARRTASEWRELLTGIDFTLLVLNAVALLSEQERRFIRDILQPDFGLERVAILINQMDLVAEDERASITELVRTFLGSFESQPVLLEFSAAQAIAGMDAIGGGDIPASSGYPVLMRLLREDLLNRHRALKAAAMRQAAELCLSQLEAAVRRHHLLLTTDEAELQALLNQLDPQSQRLQERTERAQHRVEAFVNTLLKEQCMRDMEAFSSTLRQQLPDEITKVENVQSIKHHLPGYLETVWTEFFNYQMPSLRKQLADEVQQVSDTAINDLQELLGSQSPHFQQILRDFDPVPPSMKAFIMPARGHHPAGTTATWMQVGGLALLISFPQISLALIGVGQAVRLVFRGDIASADKRAIITSVINTTYELEHQIKQQVERHFEALGADLKQAVADLYRQGIEQIRASLQGSLTRQTEVTAQQEQVERVSAVILPELRQMLHELTGGKPAA